MTEIAHDLDILYMPTDLKQQFCLDLLESVGAEKIRVSEDRGEIIHCCVTPWHNESRPSASLNFEKMVYKCLGCNSSGGILWLIGTTQGVYGPEARNWLAEQTGLGGKEFQLAPLLQFLDAIAESQSKSAAPKTLTRYSEAVLEPWSQIYPGLTTGVPELGIEGRGIPEENLVEARVGWDMDDNRVIIPHFWDGSLVGWQARRILDSTPEKYKSTPDFPRDRTLYLPQAPGRKPGKRIVVVESPMTVLRHMHHQPMGGTFGFVITPAQVALLKWYPEIVFWVDNDEAGWQILEGRWEGEEYHEGPAQTLTAYSNVSVVPSDWVGDPADLDDEVVDDLVDQAIPLSLWERPTALRCLICKQPHGGPCAP